MTGSLEAVAVAAMGAPGMVVVAFGDVLAGAVGIAAGTALPVVAAATGAGAFAASFSLFHSMYRSVATISQAKRRKTRVWFMRGARARVVAALRFEKRSARKFKGMGAMR